MKNIRCACASCPYLKKGSESTGVCVLFYDELMEQTGNCILTRDMPKGTTLKILHDLQKWRRGGFGPMIPPYVAGCAIDSAIKHLRKHKVDERNQNYQAGS